MVELRKFITMDNHEAVKIGELHKAQQSLPAVKPKFTADFPEVVVRAGADDQCGFTPCDIMLFFGLPIASDLP